ncbi:hypothetical protein OCU04_006479 [Sclerotinia nivalis]|uniref:Uncharacterized protein n=1 Tax=Sclerotinia nivalis TaxID=352851 RepID=A0A9X0AN59_9HELO|nr:hypothetical protein OCU04_006479 [Sclerotinia nivalis]
MPKPIDLCLIEQTFHYYHQQDPTNMSPIWSVSSESGPPLSSQQAQVLGGALTHLAAPPVSLRYSNIAIANSIVESAKTSMAFHKLAADVKAYGSAEQMTLDSDVNFVAFSLIVAKR